MREWANCFNSFRSSISTELQRIVKNNTAIFLVIKISTISHRHSLRKWTVNQQSDVIIIIIIIKWIEKYYCDEDAKNANRAISSVLGCCVRRRGISLDSRLQQREIVWAKIQAGGSKQGGSRGWCQQEFSLSLERIDNHVCPSAHVANKRRVKKKKNFV
jgi:hypothetical protein